MGDPVIARLQAWGEGRPSVRAMLLTSTRAIPNATVDVLSDYDVIVAVTDIHPYLADDSWLEDFGRVLVVYRDPVRLWYGLEKFARITQYEDGLKIDFTICPPEPLRRIAAEPELPPDLDVGYAVLLDKDGLTAGLKPPTHRAYIPSPPAEAEYQRVVEEFFHEATYVAKHLWRGDLMAAKYNLDYAMKHDNLRQMLEWRLEIAHGWSVRPGTYGRGLRRYLDPATWAELERSYVGGGEEENWEALFRTIDLFRRVAVEVGESLGYGYPDELHERAVRYLQRVKALDRGAKSFS